MVIRETFLFAQRYIYETNTKYGVNTQGFTKKDKRSNTDRQRTHTARPTRAYCPSPRTLHSLLPLPFDISYNFLTGKNTEL